MISIDLVVLDPYSDDGWVKTQTMEAVVGTVDSGAKTVVQCWDEFQRTYQPSFTSMSIPERSALMAFHRLRRGVCRGFLIWDIYECFASLQRIGTGDGTTKVFQLVTVDADATTSLTRKIRNPVPTGTELPINVRGYVPGATTAAHAITVGGNPRTEGSQYSIDPATGLLTFATAPPVGAAIVWTGWYFTPVTFKDKALTANSKSILSSSTPTLEEVIGQ